MISQGSVSFHLQFISIQRSSQCLEKADFHTVGAKLTVQYSNYNHKLLLFTFSCTDLQVKFSTAAYTVSEGAGLFAAVIQRCGQFAEEVNILLTYQDITAQGYWNM